MKIIRRPRNLQEQAETENSIAQNYKNKANIDYIAMMADIEIPTEDNNGTFKEI